MLQNVFPKTNYGGKLMEEEILRRMAIEQYLQEKAPASIYREMGRSKKCFFEWLPRYQSGMEQFSCEHLSFER